MAKFQQEGRGVHPYLLANERLNHLARMLPLQREQRMVYRMGEKNPPGLSGYGPIWEAVNMILPARGTAQARVNVQRDFHLLALSASASVSDNGGFRVQFYDVIKQRRFADRGVKFPNFAGGASGAVYLREPYEFDQPDSQIYVVMQNLEIVANTVQIVFAGVALRFNEAGGIPWPGGNVRTGG
jgi:hypothetical protein